MIIFKKQSGFAPLIAIFIVVDKHKSFPKEKETISEEKAKNLEKPIESREEKTEEPLPASLPTIPQKPQEQESVSQKNVINAIDVCKEIKNSYRQQICIASIEKDVAKCQDEDCYFHIAVQKGEVALCDKISDSHYENKAV